MIDKKVVYTAILGNYDSLKEPKLITEGWDYICYTNNETFLDPDFKTAWQMRRVSCLPGKEQLLARFIKLNYHLFVDGARQSIWIDGSFRINVNLDEWWDNTVDPGKMISVIKHPERDCFYKEAAVCKQARKDNILVIMEQEKAYVDIVPVENGLIQSGILMRRLSEKTIHLCIEWWNETKKHSIRDQLSFCKVSLNKDFIQYVEGYNYDIRKEFIFEGHQPPVQKTYIVKE